MLLRTCNKKLVTFLLFFCGDAQIIARIPPYKSTPVQEKYFVLAHAQKLGCLAPCFTDLIPPTDVNLIVKVGAGNGFEALQLSECYHAPVVVFECNPETINACKKTFAYQPNITLIPLAAWNDTDAISFYPMIKTKNENELVNASSFFKTSPYGQYRKYSQEEISVIAVRLDEWLKRQKIKSVTMFCIDSPGAALQVLKGIGEYYVNMATYVIVRLEHEKTFLGESNSNENNFSNVAELLKLWGHVLYSKKHDKFYVDYLFINRCRTEFLTPIVEAKKELLKKNLWVECTKKP